MNCGLPPRSPPWLKYGFGPISSITIFWPAPTFFSSQALAWSRVSSRVSTTSLWTTWANGPASAIALAGPLAHVVHNDVVLTRDDTRDQAKAWLLKNVGAGQKIVIELIGPKPYFNQGGERGGNPQFIYYPMPSGTMVEKYAQTLSPSLLDTYARGGYCHVVIGSIQKGRVTKDPAKAPAAASAYYKALE